MEENNQIIALLWSLASDRDIGEENREKASTLIDVLCESMNEKSIALVSEYLLSVVKSKNTSNRMHIFETIELLNRINRRDKKNYFQRRAIINVNRERDREIEEKTGNTVHDHIKELINAEGLSEDKLEQLANIMEQVKDFETSWEKYSCGRDDYCFEDYFFDMGLPYEEDEVQEYDRAYYIAMHGFEKYEKSKIDLEIFLDRIPVRYYE